MSYQIMTGVGLWSMPLQPSRGSHSFQGLEVGDKKTGLAGAGRERGSPSARQGR